MTGISLNIRPTGGFREPSLRSAAPVLGETAPHSRQHSRNTRRSTVHSSRELQVSLVSVSDSSIIDHTLHPNSHTSSICVLSSHVLKCR